MKAFVFRRGRRRGPEKVGEEGPEGEDRKNEIKIGLKCFLCFCGMFSPFDAYFLLLISLSLFCLLRSHLLPSKRLFML